MVRAFAFKATDPVFDSRSLHLRVLLANSRWMHGPLPAQWDRDWVTKSHAICLTAVIGWFLRTVPFFLSLFRG